MSEEWWVLGPDASKASEWHQHQTEYGKLSGAHWKLLQRARAAEPFPQNPSSLSELQDPAALCMQESNVRCMLTLTVKKDCPASVHIISLVKDNRSAEEHRLPRGEKMCASAPFVHTLYITLSLNSAAASSSIRGPAKPSLQESLACSCPWSKRTKDAGSGWQSLPTWDCLSQQGTVMKLALRAVLVFRLFVPQCCLVQGYSKAWNQTWLKGAASGGVRPCCTTAPRGSSQAFPPTHGFCSVRWQFHKAFLHRPSAQEHQDPQMPLSYHGQWHDLFR